jgi:hypothetical protein
MGMGDEARASVNAASSEKSRNASVAEDHWIVLKGWLDEFSQEFVAEAIKYPYVRPNHRQAGQLPPTLFERIQTSMQPQVWEVDVDWGYVNETDTAFTVAINSAGKWNISTNAYYLNRFRNGELVVRKLYSREQVREYFVRSLRVIVERNS